MRLQRTPASDVAACPSCRCPRSCAPWRLRYQWHAPSSHHRALPSSSLGNGSGDDGEQRGADKKQGNPEVQDALADILDMEIRKSKVKQDIMDDLEVRKERLRQIGTELTEDFAKEIELDKMRMDLASNMAMSETMDKFQQLEDEVQAVRDQLKADKQSLAAWERQAANSRNQGLFFGKLHKAKDAPKEEGEEDDGDQGRGGRAQLSEAAKKAVANVSEPARREAHSPLRLYMFVYLGAIATAVVVEDVLSAEPSYALDLLYTAIAVVMAFSVWSERRELAQDKGGS